MTQKARKGDYVQVHSIILPAGKRAPQVPEDTQRVPLEMRVKGFIDREAAIGDTVTITTVTGRRVTGRLVAVNPRYTHDFGDLVPELSMVGLELKRLLRGESKQ
ncbi:MAG: 2-amino-4-oxopentanoate thiolase subunit OrtA [Candidatus Bathyarchaeia archaeon]